MTPDEHRRLQRLLLRLKRANLDEPIRKPTFMEVSGASHREVAVSKALAFLLESESAHGMGDLWLRSLLCAAAGGNSAFGDALDSQVAPSSCSTEVITHNVDARMRIDVVAQAPGFVLGVENKLGASLYNDLSAYAGQVRDMAGERPALLITLTLHDEAEATSRWADACESLGVALCNVTYSELFEQVKQRMGATVMTCDRDWLVFVRDFMTTIENMEASAMEAERELFDFIGENRDDVELMIRKVKHVSRMTKEQSQRLLDMLVADDEVQAMGLPRPRIWQPSGTEMWSFVYFDVPLGARGQRIHPEIMHDITRMRLQCYTSNSAAKTAVMQELSLAGMQATTVDETHVGILELPLNTPETQLVHELKRLLRALLPIIKL